MGTVISFEVGNRPFCSLMSDASLARMESARTRIDRDIELPGGVLRVAPIETSANGRVFLPVWRPLWTEGRNLFLNFEKGRVIRIAGVHSSEIQQALDAAGRHALKIRGLALRF